MSEPTVYVLGSDDEEVARLDEQAGMLAGATAMLLRAAGLGPGMHVIDLGTGLGHVAFELADLVGPDGSVIGVDQSERMVELAEQRRAAKRKEHVRFVQGDVRSLRSDGPVDAVVARLLLFHLPDAGDVLRHLARLLRKGGTALMLDFDIGSARTHPQVPLAAAARQWVDAGFRAAGADPSVGARLGRLLRDAGMTEIRCLGIQPYLDVDDPMATRMLGGVVRALSPVLLGAGIVGEAELDLDTFEERLGRELRAADAVLLPPALVGAWGRTR